MSDKLRELMEKVRNIAIVIDFNKSTVPPESDIWERNGAEKMRKLVLEMLQATLAADTGREPLTGHKREVLAMAMFKYEYPESVNEPCPEWAYTLADVALEALRTTGT